MSIRLDRAIAARAATVPPRRARGRLPTVAALACLGPLLGACAANSALTLMNASAEDWTVAPARSIIQAHLEGQAIGLRTVYFDLDAPLVGPAAVKDEVYPRLLRDQLDKGFRGDGVDRGQAPGAVMDIAIERLKFTRGTVLIPDPSILRVRIEVGTADGLPLMRGSIESRYLPTVPVMAVPGIITPVATAFEGQEYDALARMIPAVAVACTRIASGLKEGKTLDEIAVYPSALDAGGLINPDVFLKGEPFGLRPLTSDEIVAAARRDEPAPQAP